MLPGMIKIDDLNGAGKVLGGQIPDPHGSVADDHFELGPLPSPAPGFAIDAEAELLGSFNGAHIGSGVGVANGPSFVVHGSLREHATEFTFARTGALAFRPSGAAFGFRKNDGDLDPVHQHIHFRDILFGNQGQNQLFGASDFLLVPPGDLRTNGFGSAFDSFGGDVQPREHLHRFGSQPEANGISLPTTASMRLTPGEDSRPATPNSTSTGYCPFEQWAHT